MPCQEAKVFGAIGNMLRRFFWFISTLAVC